MLPLNLYARVQLFAKRKQARGTVGAGKHLVFPAPSGFQKGKKMQASGKHVARMRCYIHVIASAATCPP